VDAGGRTRGEILASVLIELATFIVSQARYFKGMLREYSHLERVKRMKVTEKDTAGLLASYQVRGLFPLVIIDPNYVVFLPGCTSAVERNVHSLMDSTSGSRSIKPRFIEFAGFRIPYL